MLTDFQKRVLAAIARHRSPDSLVAGGSVLNRDRPRRSRDLDIFHEAVETVHRCAELDIETLRAAGFVALPAPVSRPSCAATAPKLSRPSSGLSNQLSASFRPSPTSSSAGASMTRTLP
jgi:hypothetical protein